MMNNLRDAFDLVDEISGIRMPRDESDKNDGSPFAGALASMSTGISMAGKTKKGQTIVGQMPDNRSYFPVQPTVVRGGNFSPGIDTVGYDVPQQVYDPATGSTKTIGNEHYVQKYTHPDDQYPNYDNRPLDDVYGQSDRDRDYYNSNPGRSLVSGMFGPAIGLAVLNDQEEAKPIGAPYKTNNIHIQNPAASASSIVTLTPSQGGPASSGTPGGGGGMGTGSTTASSGNSYAMSAANDPLEQILNPPPVNMAAYGKVASNMGIPPGMLGGMGDLQDQNAPANSDNRRVGDAARSDSNQYVRGVPKAHMQNMETLGNEVDTFLMGLPPKASGPVAAWRFIKDKINRHAHGDIGEYARQMEGSGKGKDQWWTSQRNEDYSHLNDIKTSLLNYTQKNPNAQLHTTRGNSKHQVYVSQLIPKVQQLIDGLFR
jgi:hypothetical protein